MDDYVADVRVCVIHQENKGLSGARNTAIENSGARFLYFLDSDDVMLPGAIDALLDCAYETGAYMVEGGYKIIDTAGKVLSVQNHEAGEMTNKKINGYAWGIAYRRELFSRIRFPEKYWYEDSVIYEVLVPLLKKEEKLFYGVENAVCSYRINPQGISRAGRDNKKSVDGLWIHLRLHDDRKRIGICDDSEYYEYILRMLRLTYQRTERQPKEVKKAIFVVWKDFILKNFSGFSTENELYERLENAVKEGNYSRYALFCKLN